MIKKKFFIIPLLLFSLILITFFYLLLLDRNPSTIPSSLLNKKFPSFETDYLLKEGKFLSSSEIESELVLVNFFATWCKPCREEHKYIQLIKKEKNVKIIGINYKDNSKKTIQWLKELGNPYYSIATDKTGRVSIEWGVYGIPETFIIDKSGLIKYRLVGAINKKRYKEISSLIDKFK